MIANSMMKLSSILGIAFISMSFYRAQERYIAPVHKQLILAMTQGDNYQPINISHHEYATAIRERPWLYGIPVNVNESQVDALEDIPGIGPRLSERIVNHRLKHGRFENEKDLDSVKGIGPGILKKIRHHIRF